MPDGGGEDVFVHISVVETAGLSDLEPGQRVSYDLHTDRARARSYAVNLDLL
jgi:CspA family cold shock protein